MCGAVYKLHITVGIVCCLQVCSLLDIPVYKSRVQALHLLFSLYLAFTNSAHFARYMILHLHLHLHLHPHQTLNFNLHLNMLLQRYCKERPQEEGSRGFLEPM